VIRPDGLLEKEMYVVQVKTPAESKGDWDFYKILKTLKAEDAYGKLADSACPLVKK
jgi:branched-chain amino acid transport system substrate-binding protein